MCDGYDTRGTWIPESPTEPPQNSCEDEEELYEYLNGPSLMFYCGVHRKWHNTYYGSVMDIHYADFLPQEPYIYGYLPF